MVNLPKLARSRGQVRADLCAAALAMAEVKGWEQLGFAHVGDYATERLGVSGREVRDLAHVGDHMRWLPELQRALCDGHLPWSKVRLIARVAGPESVERWIERAAQRTSAQLEKLVRRVERMTGGRVLCEPAPASDWERLRVFCSAEAYSDWFQVQRLASIVEGHNVPAGAALEMMTAEVLSAIPLDRAVDPPSGGPADEGSEAGAACALQRTPHRRAVEPRPNADADPWALDERLRSLLVAERRLDARVGARLLQVHGRREYRAMGYATFEGYAVEGLGMSLRKAQALLRVERVARRSPELECEYRSGALSWARAQAVVRVLELDRTADWHGRWIEHALTVTVRRLRDDARRAEFVFKTDQAEWDATGGLPRTGHGIGSAGGREDTDARAQDENADADGSNAQTCARDVDATETFEVVVAASPAAIALFWAVLHAVRRRVEAATGCAPTQGEAFGMMAEHARSVWDPGRRIPASQRVFERDDWACIVPGCSSRRNLQSHHVVLRSQGGSDEPSNRVSLCAFHHLRGVHAGTVRIRGQAPDRLHFELGVRPDGIALAEYTSGDVEVRRLQPDPR